MIKCNIQMMIKEEIQTTGSIPEIFAELTTLIAHIMSEMSDEDKKLFETKMRDEDTWTVIRNMEAFGGKTDVDEDSSMLDAVMKVGKDMGLL